MFVIRCYNDATGKIETVSEKLTEGDLPVNESYRKAVCDQFAREDTNTDHIYYAVTV